jgi:hypothetical protein
LTRYADEVLSRRISNCLDIVCQVANAVSIHRALTVDVPYAPQRYRLFQQSFGRRVHLERVWTNGYRHD